MPFDLIKQDQRRQENLEPLREERRQRLRQSAALLAWERGYAGISLGMVAVHAGLSRPQAACLYARVSDLIADTVCTHLRDLAKRVEDFAISRDLEQPQFRPKVLEQLAALLLAVLSDQLHAQQLCRQPCGLTQAQADNVAAAYHGLYMSIAGTLMACLPGLTTAPDASYALARRFLCLLDQAAAEANAPHRQQVVPPPQPGALAAALIAMAPPAPDSREDGDAEANQLEAVDAAGDTDVGDVSVAALRNIAGTIAYVGSNRGTVADDANTAIPFACAVGRYPGSPAIAAADTG